MVAEHLVPFEESDTADRRIHGAPHHIGCEAPVDAPELGFGKQDAGQVTGRWEETEIGDKGAIRVVYVQPGSPVRRDISIQVVRVAGRRVVVPIATHAVDHPVARPAPNVGQRGHARHVEVVGGCGQRIHDAIDG